MPHCPQPPRYCPALLVWRVTEAEYRYVIVLGSYVVQIPQEQARLCPLMDHVLGFISLLLLVACSGCFSGDEGPIAVDGAHFVSAPLLISEVSQNQNSSASITSEHKLSNVTEADVSVSFLGADCGCVKVTHDGVAIQPEEVFVVPSQGAGTIEMSFDVGPVAQELHYRGTFEYADEETKRPLHIETTAKVYSDIILDRVTHKCFLDAPADKSKTVAISFEHRFRSKSGVGEPPRITFLSDDVPMDGSFREGGKEELDRGLWSQSWDLLINAELPDLDERSIPPQKARVWFNAPDVEQGMIAADFSILFKRAYGISAPARLHFGVVKPGESASRRFAMQSLDEFPATILEAKGDSNSYTVELAPKGADKEHQIIVNFGATTVGKHRASLDIVTDHPTTPVVSIDLFGTVGKE